MAVVEHFTVIFIAGFLLTAQDVEGGKWKYGENGEKEWSNLYDDCGGRFQSPIYIKNDSVDYLEEMDSIQHYGYNVKPDNMTLKNNNHTAQVDILGEIYVDGGKLDNLYRLLQFHFHWGKTSARGSEHVLFGQHYPMEVHFVHRVYNTEMGKAMKMKKGLAVLGFFFQISKDDNTDLDELITKLDRIKTGGTQTNLEPFALTKLLPKKKGYFYRYEGSLTTPPCYESVQWTVYENPINISENQMKAFRKLKFGDDKEMADNYRQGQPMNGRSIYTNNPKFSPTGAGMTIVPKYAYVLLSSVFIMVHKF